MKIKSTSIAFVLKAFLVISCTTFGFGAFTTCGAQAIVGKWKGVSVKNYYSDAYAKEVGKSMEEKSAKETGNSTIEYKSDHSFLMTFSRVNDPEVSTMNGTWSLSGDQLRFTVEPKFNPRKTTTTATISINGNTMMTTAVIPPPSRITKSISICTRM